MNIALSGGLIATIDDCDAELVSGRNWATKKGGNTFYAVSGSVKMHRLIAQPADGQDVDHINRNGLDNRRENLRVCSRSENLCNQKKKVNSSSRFKGVSCSPRGFRSLICKDNKLLNLGVFDSEHEAALVYDTAAQKLHGRFARLNFPSPLLIKLAIRESRKEKKAATLHRFRCAALRSIQCEFASGDLSTRQNDVVKLLGTGLKTGAIAEALKLSVKTVESHISTAKRRLGLPSTEALRVTIARQHPMAA